MASEEAIMMESQRLYETESLADELRDEASQHLLSWGEKQIARLGGLEGDFGQQCKMLRKLLKAMNYYVGQRQNTPEEEKAGDRTRMVELAQSIELPVTDSTQEQIAAIDLSNEELPVLEALIGVLTQATMSDTTPIEAQAEAQPLSPEAAEGETVDTIQGTDVESSTAEGIVSPEESPVEITTDTTTTGQDISTETESDTEATEEPGEQGWFNSLFGNSPDQES